MNEKKILKDTRKKIEKTKESENVVVTIASYYEENIEILQKLHVAVEKHKDKTFEEILNEYYF